MSLACCFIGECITVQGRDCEADEIPEIVARLHAVTSGCGTRELSLRRNAVGQLGFHVQPVSQLERVCIFINMCLCPSP